MSTTKDKSQAELLAEREYPEHIITHETLDHSFDLHSGARKAFIKGYSAGQAERDELVKALLQAKYRIERCTEKLEKVQRETGIPSEISMLANDAVVEHITDLLTRITNP